MVPRGRYRRGPERGWAGMMAKAEVTSGGWRGMNGAQVRLALLLGGGFLVILAAILVAITVMAAVVATPDVMTMLHISSGPLVAMLRWPVLVLVLSACLYALYALGLDGGAESIAPGAIAGALGWTAMSLAFSWYVEHFGHFDRTFGSLGAVAGFMTWIWISVMVVLLGAELNSEIARAARRGKIEAYSAAKT